MPPGRPSGGFWKLNWSQNHPKWHQKLIQKRQIAPSKKSKILQRKNDGKIPGNQFLKQKSRKRRTQKMLIFHWFLQYNMHVRVLHTLSKLKLARARRNLKTTWKMSVDRRQKKRKIFESLSKVGAEMKIIQKTSSEADFYQIWLDFGVPRRFQNHQKR